MAVAVAVLATVGRTVLAVGLAALTVMVNTLVLAPLYTNDPPSAVGAARLQVGQVNMQGRSGRFDELEESLRERRVDVFVVLEPPDEWLGEELPEDGGYHVTRVDRAQVLLVARTAMTNLGLPPDPELPPTAIAFDVELGDKRVRVLAVNVPAPSTPDGRTQRNEELQAVGRWAREHPGAEIVLGDLNATPWSSAIEDLERSGDLDNSANGFGLQATWPAFAGRLGIPVDELLHSPDLTVTDRSTGPSFGSAHRSLWVTIARSASTSERASRKRASPG